MPHLITGSGSVFSTLNEIICARSRMVRNACRWNKDMTMCTRGCPYPIPHTFILLTTQHGNVAHGTLYRKTRSAIASGLGRCERVCVRMMELCWSIYWHSRRFISQIWMNVLLANTIYSIKGPKCLPTYCRVFAEATSSGCRNCNSLRNEEHN